MEQILRLSFCFVFNFKFEKGIRFGKACHIIPALLSDAGRTSVRGCVLFSYESGRGLFFVILDVGLAYTINFINVL